jgi:solute carrier family 25 carnitine/acylcarnitine transporter 20/29
VFFSAPLEYLKIQLQIDKSRYGSVYKTARRIIDAKGPLGIYKGFCAHFNRDVISYGVYFWCYFKFMDMFVKEDSHKLLAFSAGGVAGIVSWLNCYPFDPIKTLIQTTDGRTLTQYQAYQIIVRERGFRGLFRGINPVLFKAFFVHSTVFYTNGLFRVYFGKYKV